MASPAFDTLKFARRLTAAGVPQAQAEVQAEAMGEAFGFYVDNLVTKDYLDARQAALEQRVDQRFAVIDSELRLHRWILGAIAASTVLPALNSLFGWL